MTELLIKSFVKLLGSIFPAAIRWRYNSKRMAELIHARVASDGEGVELWAGDLPHIQTWMVVANRSPFSVEIDRAFLEITFGAEIARPANMTRVVVAPSSEVTLMFRASLDVFQANYIQRMRGNVSRVQMQFKAYILCNVRNFEVGKNIQTSHFKLYNFNLPTSTWMPKPD